MTNLEDITPEGSEAPVFLDTAPQVPSEASPLFESPIAGQRQQAYEQEADPLFFKWQRGEATEQEWLGKVQQIRERYPYPEGATP